LPRQLADATAEIGKGHHVIGINLRLRAATVVTAHSIVRIAVSRGETSIQFSGQPVETSIHLTPQLVPEEVFIRHHVLQIVLKDAVSLVHNTSGAEAAEGARLVTRVDQLIGEGIPELRAKYACVLRKGVARMAFDVTARVADQQRQQLRWGYRRRS